MHAPDPAPAGELPLWPLERLPALPPLRLAVVGHVEWMSLLAVDQLPQLGAIAHASACLEEPAGGGAVVAVALAARTMRRAWALLRYDSHYQPGYCGAGRDLAAVN